jgi:Fe-S oxidoreductase
MPAHRSYASHVENYYNIFGRPHEQRFDWLPEGSRLAEGAKVAYFTGCHSAYLSPEIARSTTKILNAAGVEFTLLHAEEHCCGAPLWRTGQRTDAVKLAKHNLDAIKKQGIGTLITSCAECFGTFMGFYPRIKPLDFEVLHISQVIHKMIQEGTLTLNKQREMKVTYHDPCLLGRLSERYVPWSGEIKAFGYHEPPKQWRRGTYGVYRAPRDILESTPGLDLCEMTRNAENAFCCGGGGGVPDAFPDFSLWTATERLNEAASTGVEAVISCCPWCGSSFQKAIEAEKSAMRYHDLTELVAGAIHL